MRVVVTGASGLLGSALVPALRRDGHDVLRLVRRPPAAVDELRWDPARGELEPAALADVDAVIHLAGAGIGDRRWTTAYKATIENSRVEGTTTVSRALAAAPPRPRVLLSASAVGIYGDAGDELLDESSPVGSGFLAEVCAEWEAATQVAEQAGVRVAHLRSGIVLARGGGTLGRMVPLFRLGVGGRLGSGRQHWSWISLDDEITAMRFLLTADDVSGAVNLTAPEPVTNAEFTRELAAALRRPAVLPVPAVALRIALDGLADEGVLASQRVLPRVLQRAGFAFAHRDVGAALRAAV